MKKFVLVVFIGMALAINVYGFVNEYMNYLESQKEIEEVNEYVTIVYEE